MVDKINAKNAEIYIAHVDVNEFDLATRGNDNTIAKYIDDEITAADVTDFLKISDGTTDISLEPAEDDISSTNFFGLDSSGSQNSVTTTVFNSDVDITFTKAEEVLDAIKKYILNDSGITHATYTDYESFNWGSMNTEDLLIVVRKKYYNGSSYKMGTIAIVAPTFKKPPNFSGSADDEILTKDITLTGSKGKVFEDHYSSASAYETLVNF